MSNELNEKIFRSVDTIVSARLQNLPFDQTIVGTIISVPENNSGTQKYMVDYKGAKLTVFVNSDDVKYAINEEVYILIPQGDFTGRKIITGRVINDYKEQGISEENTFLPNLTINFLDTTEKLVPVYTSLKESYTELARIEYTSDQYKKGYTTVQIAFNIVADLYNTSKTINTGKYGISITATVISQDTSDQNPGEETEITKKYSCDEMYLMNKYRTGGYTSQKFTIDVNNCIIKKIVVSAWHDGDFTDTNNKDIVVDDEINLRIKDLKVIYGYLKSDFPSNDDSDIGIYLYSLTRLHYKSSEEDNQRKINLGIRAINKKTGQNITGIKYKNLYLYVYNKSTTTNTTGVGEGWSYITNPAENWAGKYDNMYLMLPSGAQNLQAEYKAKATFTIEDSDVTPTAESKSLIFKNDAANENIFLLAGITMTPNQNNNTFYSYGQDNQLLARSDSEQIQKIAVEYHSADNSKITSLKEGVKLTYYLPQNSTMIIPTEETNQITTIKDIDYLVYEKILTKTDLNNDIFYIPFKIANLYNPIFKNNTIKCDVEINNQIYSESLDLLFGNSGSTGANYILTLDLQRQEDSKWVSKKVLLYNDITSNYRIIPQLYDYTWKKIDTINTELNTQFTWYNLTNDNIGSKITLDNNGNLKLNQILTSQSNDITSKLIVQLSCEYNGIPLKSYLAIPVSFNRKYVCADGCSIITYDITGKKPIYEKTPYQLYEADSMNNLIAVNNHVTWDLVQFNSKNLLELKGKSIIPPTVYSKDSNSAYVKATIDNNIVWIQPIIMINNTYPIAMWNDMTGAELTFNAGKLTLTSITVGQLDSEQQNGILMGTFKDVNNKDKEKYGLYAFSNGSSIFYINDNQEAYIANAEKLVNNDNKVLNVGNKNTPVYFSNGVPKTTTLKDYSTDIANLNTIITNLNKTMTNLTDRVSALEIQVKKLQNTLKP